MTQTHVFQRTGFLTMTPLKSVDGTIDRIHLDINGDTKLEVKAEFFSNLARSAEKAISANEEVFMLEQWMDVSHLTLAKKDAAKGGK